MAARNSGVSKNRGKLHIKTGDTVYVVSGKEKGKSGKVTKLLRGKNRAIVEKLNTLKMTEKLARKSKLTKKDIDEFSKKIKREARRRFIDNN